MRFLCLSYELVLWAMHPAVSSDLRNQRLTSTELPNLSSVRKLKVKSIIEKRGKLRRQRFRAVFSLRHIEWYIHPYIHHIRSSSLSLSIEGSPLGCRARIRTQACRIGGRRTTIWTTPHLIWEVPPHPVTELHHIYAAPYLSYAAPKQSYATPILSYAAPKLSYTAPLSELRRTLLFLLVLLQTNKK